MKKIGVLVALLAAMLLNGLTVATPAPASAESGVLHFAEGNRPAWFDVVKLRGTNGAHKVRLALHVRDLTTRGEFELGVRWQGGDSEVAYYVRARHTDEGLTTRYHYYINESDVDPKWRCGTNRGTVAWRPARDRIILTVPHRCLRRYDYAHVINTWDFYAWSKGKVEWEIAVDAPTTSLTLDRG
jgi:hypothetical protein